MATHRWSRRIQLSVAALAIMTASCTDGPVVPDAAVTKDFQRASNYSTINGSLVSIVDDYDGETYTLDLSKGEITRRSDGSILQLDAEQTAAAATAFYGDAAVNTLFNSFSGVCIAEGQCGAAMSGPLAGSTLPGSGLILQRESVDGRSHPSNRFGTTFVGNLPAKPFKSSKGSFTLMSGMCEDIVNSVFQSRLDYAVHRTDFVRDGFMFGVLVGVGVATRRALPVGGVGAIRFLGKVVIGQEKRIAVSILGWMWNSYSCGNGQTVNAGPLLRTFGGGGGRGSESLSCHTESWGISFDGGKSYSNISVEVCEFSQS